MAQPVVMPKMGQSDEDCTLVKWRKAEGEVVKKGDILFDLEMEKAVLEVESFHEGTLLKILVQEGATVPINTVVAYLGKPGEAIPATPPPPPPAAPKAEAPRPRGTRSRPGRSSSRAAPGGSARSAAPAPAPVAPAAPAAAPAKTRLLISPRARALAAHSVISAERIRGTGTGGRIVEKDVQAYLAAQGYDRLRISPSAKALAAQHHLDVLALRGTGDGGRIMVRDVERALAELPRPMSRMRQVIAQRLTQSVVTAPHFYVTVAVDMTDVLALRKELRTRGVQFSVTDFVLEAVVLSLQEFPVVNSVTDGRTVTWKSAVHLGMATSVEDGLVVPVIRNAQDLTLAELHEQVSALAIKAREGKLLPAEMTGSTFTVSNMGMLNVENFTAIINPGEGAILAVSSTVDQAVVRKGRIEARAVMKLTLSSDHRLIDGAVAAKFSNAIKDKLEDVELWKRLT